MKKEYKKMLGCLGIWAAGLLMIGGLHAATPTPVWTYSAPSPASVAVSEGGTAVVQYTVTNQSQKPKNLILKTLPGVSASPCYLAGNGGTCSLTLTINGSLISSEGVHAGPMLCQQSNPYQCYQPSPANILNVVKSTTPPVTKVIISGVPSSLTLTTVSPGNTGIITITNSSASTANATDISADLSGVGGALSATYSNCSSVIPGGVCTITFTAHTTLPITNIPVKGGNTNLVSVAVTVGDDQVHIDPASSSLTLTTVSPGNTGIVTITNSLTSTANATDISADLSGVGGALSATYSNCDSVIAGGVCTITFTAHTTLPITNIPVKGSNTNEVLVSVAVDQATINTSLSSFSFAQGGTTQLVTITNNGPVDAYGVGISSAPGLGINVTGSCASPMVPSDTCDLTFTSGSNTGSTTAEIAGSNTANNVIENITVIAASNTTLTVTALTSPAVIDVDGHGVQLSIVNTGSTTAYNVAYTLPSGWNGVSTSGSCGDIEPGGANACTLTFSATQPNVTNTIGFSADNAASALSRAIAFSYQGYLVYAVTPTTSTSGTAYVAAGTETENVGIVWDSSDGCVGGEGCIATNATSTTDGSANTSTIYNIYTTNGGRFAANYAAGYCYTLVSPNGTWYLPAQDELNNIYNNLKLPGFGGFQQNDYWSSTDFDENQVFKQFFFDGSQTLANKNSIFLVRCAQAITY